MEYGQNSVGQAFLKRFSTMPLVIVPIASLLLAVPIGLKVWTEFDRAKLAAPYRYSFERPSPGSVTQRLEQEIAFYQERIRRDPDAGIDRAFLANAYIKMARATGESSWYLLSEQAAKESLVKLPFSNDGALLALARVATAKHDFRDAIKLSQQATPSQDTLAVAVVTHLALGQLTLARQASDRMVAQNPDLATLTTKGLVDVAQGKDQAAIQSFQQGLAAEEPEEAGSSVWARTILGRLYFKRGQLEMAEKLYRESLRVMPQSLPAMLNLAELDVRRGNYRTAEDRYSNIALTAQRSPTVYDHIVFRGMARVKELQGDAKSANEWRDRAEERLRRDLTAFGHRRELARLLLERDRPQDLTEALSLMQQEVKVRRDAETLDTLAWVLSRMGRWQEAQQAMQEALRGGIRDAALFQRAGTIAQTLGNTAQATAFFKAAQDTDPTFDEQAQKALGLGVGLLGLN
ncbi:MAG: tetratricopeptide repeat protein [Tildeniella nuda ZEHNDER 1965/U140]|jgi:tetratricopeptide (TPR) repeat protein|nr:tetratricopeptide repeat protein [Tildeniella nuda ZEHNDER 1965/U140]